MKKGFVLQELTKLMGFSLKDTKLCKTMSDIKGTPYYLLRPMSDQKIHNSWILKTIMSLEILYFKIWKYFGIDNATFPNPENVSFLPNQFND